MFSLLRRVTSLDGELNSDGTESNVWEKDQGNAQWPDLPSYVQSPAFNVNVRILFPFSPIFSILKTTAKTND